MIWVDKLGGMFEMEDLLLEMENVIFVRAYGRDIAEEEQSLQIGQILTKMMTEVVTMKQKGRLCSF